MNEKRDQSLLRAGEVAGTLNRLLSEIDEAEMLQMFGDPDFRYKALLAFTLAMKHAMEHNGKLVVIGVTEDGTCWITCPDCGRTSHNRNDVQQLFCGHCNKFHLHH